jgi:parvulin-like peptidyl-prolyl isomerase
MARKLSATAKKSNVKKSGRKKRLSLLLGSVVVVALCIAARYYKETPSAQADPTSPVQAQADEGATIFMRPSSDVSGEPERSTMETVPVQPPSRDVRAGTSPGRNNASQTPRSNKASGRSPLTTSIPAVVATVNHQRITREDLAYECRRCFGKELLETMSNKRLIAEACRRQGITVTREEVNTEIEHMSKRFNIPPDQFLKLLQQERNVTPAQYASDIIWPSLALRKLAGDRLTVSREEVFREYETVYGEAVCVRLIAVSDLEKAKKLRAQAAAHPKEFGNLAKDHSEDAPSAALKGMIQPIRKHGSYQEIEDAAFQMNDNEISQVIHVEGSRVKGEEKESGQYVILKRERGLPPREVKFEQVAQQLEETLRDRKMRSVAQDVFRQLQGTKEDKKVVNVWNNPEMSRRMPGVAALVDGTTITIRELDEECLERHGKQVLEGLITRKILEQACTAQKIAVSDEDIDQEIARAALANVRTKPDGSPDVEAWLELVTKKQGVSLSVYRGDVVWPTVALKKIVGAKIEITEEDIRKGFEANYGPRVRCKAIVLNNQRRAQQVFEMARKNNTSQNFGKLASEYSIEAGSQALEGEIPPIKRYGGQPQIEQEAFSLKPGELSGVIQMGDHFIILRCEGFTKPISVDFAKVRDEIYRDLYEKKLRIAMAERYETLKANTTIDNILTGDSYVPKRSPPPTSAGRVPTLRQVGGQKLLLP